MDFASTKRERGSGSPFEAGENRIYCGSEAEEVPRVKGAGSARIMLPPKLARPDYFLHVAETVLHLASTEARRGTESII